MTSNPASPLPSNVVPLVAPNALLNRPLSPGDWVDRYELLYPTAKGGMGTVWAARMRGMNQFERLFAIKMVLPEYAGDPNFRAMFLDEARICAGIAHPNVAQVFEMGQHPSGLYLVMEWIDGDSLHLMSRVARKAGGHVPLAVLLRVVADACAGLHAAHELKNRDGELLDVVHRDVSPQNVLVTTAGTVKLIDFGIAKARNRLIAETSQGVVKGKLRYMAPEQATGAAVDRRADVWSMGAVLYSALTGQAPYGSNDAAALNAIASRWPCLPLPETVPQPVRDVVHRAVAFDKDDRFASAREMKDAVERVAEELNLKATTATVESFYRTAMSERVEMRRRSFDLATSNIAEREKVRTILHDDAVSYDSTSKTRPAVPSQSRRMRIGTASGTPPAEAYVPPMPARVVVPKDTGAAVTGATAFVRAVKPRYARPRLVAAVAAAVVAAAVLFTAVIVSARAPTSARGMAPTSAEPARVGNASQP